MSHYYYCIPIPPGQPHVIETCRHCGQQRKRSRNGALNYRTPEGTYAPERPLPCRIRKMAQEVDRLVRFWAVE